MPKPFGKPTDHRWRIPRLARGGLLALVSAPVAFIVLSGVARRYPLLSPGMLSNFGLVLFWPLFTFALVQWFRKRPSPRGPWEGSSVLKFGVHVLLGAIVAALPAFICSHAYEPAMRILNAKLGSSVQKIDVAMVEKEGAVRVLRSPYWKNDFTRQTNDLEGNPPPQGGVAILTVSKGALGATWIRSVEYQVLETQVLQ